MLLELVIVFLLPKKGNFTFGFTYGVVTERVRRPGPEHLRDWGSRGSYVVISCLRELEVTCILTRPLKNFHDSESGVSSDYFSLTRHPVKKEQVRSVSMIRT